MQNWTKLALFSLFIPFPIHAGTIGPALPLASPVPSCQDTRPVDAYRCVCRVSLSNGSSTTSYPLYVDGSSVIFAASDAMDGSSCEGYFGSSTCPSKLNGMRARGTWSCIGVTVSNEDVTVK